MDAGHNLIEMEDGVAMPSAQGLDAQRRNASELETGTEDRLNPRKSENQLQEIAETLLKG
jgi:hypothetical protein